MLNAMYLWDRIPTPAFPRTVHSRGTLAATLSNSQLKNKK